MFKCQQSPKGKYSKYFKDWAFANEAKLYRSTYCQQTRVHIKNILLQQFTNWPFSFSGGMHMVHEREDSVTCGPIMPQGGIQVSNIFVTPQQLTKMTVFNWREDENDMTELAFEPWLDVKNKLKRIITMRCRIMHSALLKLILWLQTSNENALFQQLCYDKICSWHRVQFVLPMLIFVVYIKDIYLDLV